MLHTHAEQHAYALTPPHSLHTHTRLPHYPSVAQSWCADEIKIDRNASRGLGIRTHFPDNDVTDVAEKCSWDKYCAGTQRQGSDPEHAACRREDLPSTRAAAVA